MPLKLKLEELHCRVETKPHNIIGDSKSYLSGLPRATHKCVSIFWPIFLGTFWECRKVITHKCPRINIYPTSHLCVVLHVLIFSLVLRRCREDGKCSRRTHNLLAKLIAYLLYVALRTQ